jgi:hypothetical protein
MQIKETIGVSFPGSVESPPLEDIVVLVDGADSCSGLIVAGANTSRPVERCSS